MKKCKRCKIEKDNQKLRRGLCIRCYRIMTGLSGGDSLLLQFEKDLIKLKNRVSIMELQFKELKERQEERKHG